MKIDVVVRQFLRLILGSLKSTPTEHLHAEAGIVPIRKRYEWFSQKYIVKLSQAPDNPNIKLIEHLTDQQLRPRRYTPAIATSVSAVINIVPDLLIANNVVPRSHTPNLDIEAIHMPISKKEAITNPTLSRSIFNETIIRHSRSHALLIFTDGCIT